MVQLPSPSQQLSNFLIKNIPADIRASSDDTLSFLSSHNAHLCSKYLPFISALTPTNTEDIPAPLISILSSENLSSELKTMLTSMKEEIAGLKSDIVHGECEALSQLEEELKLSGLYEFSNDLKDSLGSLLGELRPLLISMEENRQAIGSLLEQKRELQVKRSQAQLSEEIHESLKQLEDIQSLANQLESENM
jgi:hypothetical protein